MTTSTERNPRGVGSRRAGAGRGEPDQPDEGDEGERRPEEQAMLRWTTAPPGRAATTTSSFGPPRAWARMPVQRADTRQAGAGRQHAAEMPATATDASVRGPPTGAGSPGPPRCASAGRGTSPPNESRAPDRPRRTHPARAPSPSAPRSRRGMRRPPASRFRVPAATSTGTATRQTPNRRARTRAPRTCRRRAACRATTASVGIHDAPPMTRRTMACVSTSARKP